MLEKQGEVFRVSFCRAVVLLCCLLRAGASHGKGQQVCLTLARGCSSWCTPRQCSLLSAVLGSATPFAGQPRPQCSPHHPIAHWGRGHGAEPCFRAWGHNGLCQQRTGHLWGQRQKRWPQRWEHRRSPLLPNHCPARAASTAAQGFV